MALTIPTIEDIKDLIIQDLTAQLNQTIKLLPKAFIRVLASVLAAIYIQLYKYGGFIFLQIFVSTASFSETTIFGNTLIPLVEWGRLFGIGDPTPATQAVLTIEVTVEVPGTLPSGTQFISSLNNIIYITIAAFAITSPTHQIQVTAATAGIAGNLSASDILQTVNPLAAIARDVTVISLDTTAVDAESEVAYRSRVLGVKQSPPQGGAFSDYRIWSVEVASIIKAYPYSGDPANVLVYCEANKTDFPPDGIPSSAKLLEVAASIDQADRRPVTAIIDPADDGSYTNIRAITRRTFDVDVNSLVVSNPSQIQDDIEEALTNYFFDREPFIDGLTVPPRKDKITASNVNSIIDDIVTANNGSFSSSSVETGAVPVSEYILAQGETAKLGNLTFT